MLNTDIWNFANKQFNKAFVTYAFIGCLAAIVLQTISTSQLTWQPMIILLCSLGATILTTEQHLSQNFDKEGKRKKLKK